jgi:hypothetical protein
VVDRNPTETRPVDVSASSGTHPTSLSYMDSMPWPGPAAGAWSSPASKNCGRLASGSWDLVAFAARVCWRLPFVNGGLYDRGDRGWGGDPARLVSYELSPELSVFGGAQWRARTTATRT